MMMARASKNTATPARRKRLDWRRLTFSTEGSRSQDAPEPKTMKRGSGAGGGGGILQKLKSLPSHRPSFSKHRGKQHADGSLRGQSSQHLMTDHRGEPAALCDAVTESSDQEEQQPTKTTKTCAQHEHSGINVQRRRSSRSLYSRRSLGSPAAMRRTSGRRRDSSHSSSSRRSSFQPHKSSGCIDTKSNIPGAVNTLDLDTSETIRLRYMNEYFESCLFEWNDELNADPNRPSLLAFDGSVVDSCSCRDTLDDEIIYIEKNFGDDQCGAPMHSISIKRGEALRGSMVSAITLVDMEE